MHRSLKSPQILELSGIGRKDILEAIDVPVKVDLPGVGENLQEHTNVGISFGMAILSFARLMLILL